MPPANEGSARLRIVWSPGEASSTLGMVLTVMEVVAAQAHRDVARVERSVEVECGKGHRRLRCQLVASAARSRIGRDEA